MPKVFLIPNLIGGTDINLIPQTTINEIKHLRHFVVENLREARRYLVKLDMQFTIDEMHFQEMNKHATQSAHSYLAPLKEGHDLGVLSDAGVPGIADPGEEIVLAAHKEGYDVMPLVGPSSILLALMSSGLNGERFQFHGYLPIKAPERIQKLKQIEGLAKKTKGSQIFMETPYRNNALFDDIVKTCGGEVFLSISTDLSLESAFVKTKRIKDWRSKKPELHKRPCIFILGIG